MANRLKERPRGRVHFREMTLEGILGIQAGDNPRVVPEKLMAYVPPSSGPPRGAGAAKAARSRLREGG